MSKADYLKKYMSSSADEEKQKKKKKVKKPHHLGMKIIDEGELFLLICFISVIFPFR